jgi:CHAD domain-containing protein
MRTQHIPPKILLQYKNNQLKILSQLLTKSSKRLTSNRIHQLRVTIRRLSVVLTSRKLQKLAKVLGKDRDLDVAIKNAKIYHMGSKKLKQAKRLARKDSEKAVKKFALKGPERSSRSKLVVIYKRMMRKNLVEFEKYQSINLGHKKLHKLRILMKEIRYGLEAIGKPDPKLKKMQDLLGHIHDLEVLEKLKFRKKSIQKEKEATVTKVKSAYLGVDQLIKKSLGQI